MMWNLCPISWKQKVIRSSRSVILLVSSMVMPISVVCLSVILKSGVSDWCTLAIRAAIFSAFLFLSGLSGNKLIVTFKLYIFGRHFFSVV